MKEKTCNNCGRKNTELMVIKFIPNTTWQCFLWVMSFCRLKVRICQSCISHAFRNFDPEK